MANPKANCHICGNQMKVNTGEETPVTCTVCNADMADVSTETLIHRTSQSDAGGIKAVQVDVLLTDRRLIFKKGNESFAKTVALTGGQYAVAAMLNKRSDDFIAILLTDIVSVEVKISGLFKNKVELTVNTNDNNVYKFTLPEKEVEQWRLGLSKHIAK